MRVRRAGGRGDRRAASRKLRARWRGDGPLDVAAVEYMDCARARRRAGRGVPARATSRVRGTARRCCWSRSNCRPAEEAALEALGDLLAASAR